MNLGTLVCTHSLKSARCLKDTVEDKSLAFRKNLLEGIGMHTQAILIFSEEHMRGRVS